MLGMRAPAGAAGRSWSSSCRESDVPFAAAAVREAAARDDGPTLAEAAVAARPGVRRHPSDEQAPLLEAPVRAAAALVRQSSLTQVPLLHKAVAHTTLICDVRRVPASGGPPLDSPAS